MVKLPYEVFNYLYLTGIESIEFLFYLRIILLILG